MPEKKPTPPAPLGSQDPAWRELLEDYASGQLVVFAGPALSTAAGLRSWAQVAQVLADQPAMRQEPQHHQEMLGYIQSGLLVEAFSLAQSVLGRSEFATLVERMLSDAPVKVLPQAARALGALKPRLRAVLTTNLDHLLERAFAGSWPALWKPAADVARRRHFILKLHGTLLERSSWVFTRDQYDRAIAADPLLRQAYAAFFNAFPLLFIGFSLVDDDFETLLSQVRALSGDSPPRNYALVAEGSVQGFRRQSVEKAGIRLIEYPNPDGKHSKLPEVLEWLTS